MPQSLRSAISAFLCPLLMLNAGAVLLAAQEAPMLNIIILEGNGAINNIKQRTAREPIVEVQDQNHRPVAGAVVLFELPEQGASGTFAQGAHSATFTTDQSGRVIARGLQPNRTAGQFQIKVTASSQGRTATTTISQTNAAALAGAAVAAGISLKVILIVVAAGAAAAAGGVYAATHIGGGGRPPTTITPGTPTVGAP